MPWTDRGHGRTGTRTIQLTDAPGDLAFPHVSQAYLIERHVTALDGTPLSGIAAPGVTSLDTTRTSPPAIAGLVRGQQDRVPALAPPHPLPRRQLHRPHPPGHGPWPP